MSVHFGQGMQSAGGHVVQSGHGWSGVGGTQAGAGESSLGGAHLTTLHAGRVGIIEYSAPGHSITPNLKDDFLVFLSASTCVYPTAA